MSNEAINRLAKHLSAAQKALQEIELQVGFDDDPRPGRVPEQHEKIARQAALTSILERRARDSHFDRAAIFEQPSWAILLAVYVCQTRNEKITLDSLSTCGQSAAISLRWVNVLEQHGLLYCFADAENGSHQLVKMTDRGNECMTRYLSEISRV